MGCKNQLNFTYLTMKFVNYHYPTLHTYVIPRQPTNSIVHQMSALNSKFCKYHSLKVTMINMKINGGWFLESVSMQKLCILHR